MIIVIKVFISADYALLIPLFGHIVVTIFKYRTPYALQHRKMYIQNIQIMEFVLHGKAMPLIMK